MARYNREFLVPYLRDVCALHLAEKEIGSRRVDLELRVGYINNAQNLSKPKSPYQEEAGFNTFLVGLEVVLAVICGIVFLAARFGIIRFFAFIGAAFFGIAAYVIGKGVKETNENNEKRLSEYRQEINSYHRTVEKNRSLLNEIPALKSQIAQYENEEAKISMLLNKVYGANVIPRQYRNIYVAVYLYDWFSTGMSDDLDHALSMFVLEEIKAKLDRIIENQKEIIFNQYQIASNQQKFMEQQQSHSEMMHAKLDQIQASNEERNAYLHMIESNTATTAYFAAADYIRRI